MTNLLYPTTNLREIEQVKLSSGKGVYVTDSNGKTYLEGMAGLWCASLGYGNEELIDAIRKQLVDLSYGHMFGGKTHQVAIDLGDKLSEIVPIDDAKIFLGNSGSDANDSLVKFVRYFNLAKGRPEKRKIISRDRAYHGVTMASATLTGLTSHHTNFDLPFDALGVLRVDAPHYYQNAKDSESESEFCRRLIKQVENLIEYENADTIAAFIAEPVNGAGGVVVPPDGYFEGVQKLLKEHDILFLDDEVICGFGRTGNDFGATTYDLKPDTMTLAKGLSSAYFPISASVISGEMYDQIEKASSKTGVFGHGYTYSGHPVGCVAALKTIEIYERENLYAKAAKTGAYLRTQLKAAFNHNLMVGEIRGVGLIAAVQFVADRDKKEFLVGNSFVVDVQKRCQENGLLLRALSDNSLAICPPLIITETEIDELVDKLKLSVEEVIQKLRRED